MMQYWNIAKWPNKLDKLVQFLMQFSLDHSETRVAEELLVERVVGRRLDPVTGKIYHLKYSLPENDEISARLTQRFDDTGEKVKLHLHTHHQNVEAVLSMYEDRTF